MIHQIKIHENPTRTSDSAPYIGTYVERDTVGLDTLSNAIAKESGLPQIMTRAIIESEFEEIAELEREAPVRANFDGFSVCATITGSFQTSDAAFDPEHNRFALAIRLDDSLRLALVNVTPSIVTDATSKRVAINEVSDIAEPRPYGVIHGQRQFLVAGYNLILTDEGAGLFMQDKNGTVFDLVVDEAADPQKIKAHTSTLLEPGDYKVVVKSRGGDAEGGLQTRFKRVKYLAVAPQGPEVTRVKQQNPDLPEDVIDFGGPIIATGENLQMGEGDTIKIELYEGGEPVDVLDRLGAIVSTPTAISFTCSNTSHHPDGEWMGKDVLLTVTINGVSATRWLKFRDDS